MPNLRAGFTIRACLPASPALSTVEQLAGKVVPVPFDESTVVEGMVCPTTASSPDAEVRGTLVAGLKKTSSQNQRTEDNSSRLQSTSYIPIASSLGGTASLPHSRMSTRPMICMSIFASTRTMCPVIIPDRFRSFCISSFIIRTKAFDFGRIFRIRYTFVISTRKAGLLL